MSDTPVRTVEDLQGRKIQVPEGDTVSCRAMESFGLAPVTLPVGLNLFIAGYRFEQPITRIYRATIPFSLILLLCVVVITYWPQLSLALAGNWNSGLPRQSRTAKAGVRSYGTEGRGQKI